MITDKEKIEKRLIAKFGKSYKLRLAREFQVDLSTIYRVFNRLELPALYNHAINHLIDQK